MKIITADARRLTTTPNATMTTLASPTLGNAGSAVWTVQMNPNAEGPEHAFEGEVIWAVTCGEANLFCEAGVTLLSAGDTAVLPGQLMRRFVAGPDGFEAVVATSAPGMVRRGDDGSLAVPPWVA